MLFISNKKWKQIYQIKKEKNKEKEKKLKQQQEKMETNLPKIYIIYLSKYMCQFMFFQGVEGRLFGGKHCELFIIYLLKST